MDRGEAPFSRGEKSGMGPAESGSNEGLGERESGGEGAVGFKAGALLRLGQQRECDRVWHGTHRSGERRGPSDESSLEESSSALCLAAFFFCFLRACLLSLTSSGVSSTWGTSSLDDGI